MNLKELAVIPEGRILSPEVQKMLINGHYRRTCRSLFQKEVFTLWHEDLMIGVAVFGRICSAAGAKIHGARALELRRLYLINEAPKNSESYFLGACLRYLRNTRKYSKVITFADPNKGHEGIIYKATNFKYTGLEKYRQQVLKIGEREVSMRQVYQKSKSTGKYVKSALEYQEMKRKGLARAILTKPKHCFEYQL